MVGSEGRRGARPGAGARPGGAFSHPAPRLPPPLRPGSRWEAGEQHGRDNVWDNARKERGGHRSKARQGWRKSAAEQQVGMKRGQTEVARGRGKKAQQSPSTNDYQINEVSSTNRGTCEREWLGVRQEYGPGQKRTERHQ